MRKQASVSLLEPIVSYLRYTTFPCWVFEIFAPVPSYRGLNVVILGLYSLITAFKRIGKIPNMEKLANTLLERFMGKNVLESIPPVITLSISFLNRGQENRSSCFIIHMRCSER